MTRHASTTSLASAGRSVMRPGIARSAMSCSTGWCVGPSCPRPIESCVKMVIDRKLHQRAQSDGRLHVVGKDKEGRSVGADLGQREPVHDRAHGVLANAEVKIAAAIFVGLEISGRLKCETRLGRGARSAAPPISHG